MPEKRASSPPRLAANVVEEARRAWPGVSVSDEELGAYVAAHAFDPEEACVRDLYLACACARGEPAALAAFDKQLLEPLGVALERQGTPAHVAHEVVQILRTRLLLGEDGDPPRIVDYAGRGPLARWLRVSGVREASKVHRHERVHAGLRPDEPPPPATPEELAIRARYGEAVHEAFKEAFRALPADDRLILRLHFSEGLNLDRLATTLSFSRATAGRRLLAARSMLRDEVMRLLGSRIEASPTEAESVFAALRSHLEISLGALVSAA